MELVLLTSAGPVGHGLAAVLRHLTRRGASTVAVAGRSGPSTRPTIGSLEDTTRNVVRLQRRLTLPRAGLQTSKVLGWAWSAHGGDPASVRDSSPFLDLALIVEDLRTARSLTSVPKARLRQLVAHRRWHVLEALRGPALGSTKLSLFITVRERRQWSGSQRSLGLARLTRGKMRSTRPGRAGPDLLGLRAQREAKLDLHPREVAPSHVGRAVAS
mmetsp:Transcript_2234/g.5772  ORF Transcript_2234/g.5772 Transcript_2234/m.5772 type:complete len:215 (+) Transcript_2234:829-1473(+)